MKRKQWPLLLSFTPSPHFLPGLGSYLGLLQRKKTAQNEQFLWGYTPWPTQADISKHEPLTAWNWPLMGQTTTIFSLWSAKRSLPIAGREVTLKTGGLVGETEQGASCVENLLYACAAGNKLVHTLPDDGQDALDDSPLRVGPLQLVLQEKTGLWLHTKRECRCFMMNIFLISSLVIYLKWFNLGLKI